MSGIQKYGRGRVSPIFLDEYILFPDYTPLRLPHRESQLKSVLGYIADFAISGKVGQHVVLYGRVGTGKTAVSKMSVKMVVQRAKKARANAGFAFVNCHRVRTVHGVLSEIAKILSPFVVTKGLPTSEIAQLIGSKLVEGKVNLITILDEVDYLLESSGDELLYSLTRFNEFYPSRPLSLILVSRSLSFTDHLTDSVKSTLKRNYVEFPSYTAGQLKDILLDRLEEAFQPGVVSEDVVGFVGELSAQEGDARFALELLWKSGKEAEQEKCGVVNAEHVRRAFSSMVKSLALDALPNLGDHELILLYSVCRKLRDESSSYVTIGDAEKEYYRLCEQLNVSPRRHTQVWGYVQSLSSIGLLLTQISGKGQRGKTTNITLSGSPLEPMIQEVQKQLRRRRISQKAGGF
jgi:cell division control protein 6